MPGIPKGPVAAFLIAGALALAPWRLAAASDSEDLTVFDFDAPAAASAAKPAAVADKPVSDNQPVLAPPAASASTSSAQAASTSAAPASPTAQAAGDALSVATASATPQASPAPLAASPSFSPTPAATVAALVAAAPSATASASPSPSPEASAPVAVVQLEGQENASAEEEPTPTALNSSEVLVERGGALAQADELRLDGKIQGVRSGGHLLVVNDIAYLEMAGGHAAVPGQEYLSYRLSDPVLDPISGDDLGSRVTVSGVLKVIHVDGAEVLARVTHSYVDLRVGDSFRQRGEKMPHSRPAPLAGDLRGSLAAIRGGQELAGKGEVVYLDLGASQGVQPGMRFIVERPVGTQEQQDSFDSAPIQANGDLGVVEVLSVLRHTCTALVIRSSNAMKVGDRIRLR